MLVKGHVLSEPRGTVLCRAISVVSRLGKPSKLALGLAPRILSRKSTAARGIDLITVSLAWGRRPVGRSGHQKMLRAAAGWGPAGKDLCLLIASPPMSARNREGAFDPAFRGNGIR